MTADRLDAAGEVSGAHEEPDLGPGADGNPVGPDRQAHGPLEVMVGEGQVPLRDADRDDIAA